MQHGLTTHQLSSWKRSPFATKSVSQLSSSITPRSPSALAVTKPLEVARPSRLGYAFKTFNADDSQRPYRNRHLLHLMLFCNPTFLPQLIRARRFTSSAEYAN
jgi:hypothetical protein